MGVQSKARYIYEPDVVFPPGDTLAEWLNERGMTQTELATRAGLSTKHVNQIVKGAAPITTETALGLERVTGIPAHVWNNLEMSYRSHLTRLAEQERLADDAEWLNNCQSANLSSEARSKRRAGVRRNKSAKSVPSLVWPILRLGAKCGNNQMRRTEHRRHS